MADLAVNFEASDNNGSSVAFSGTATTTPANFPAAAGNIISQIGLTRDGDVPDILEVSLDGGTTFFPLRDTDSLTWDVKGQITQIIIKSSTNTVNFNMLINFEEY